MIDDVKDIIEMYDRDVADEDLRLGNQQLVLDLTRRVIKVADGTSDPNTALGVSFHYRWKRR